VNRTSRAIRDSSEEAISLKESTTGCRSGSCAPSSRRSSSPEAMAAAASATPANGRSTRRDSSHPTIAPPSVATPAPMNRVVASVSIVSRYSASDTNSK